MVFDTKKDFMKIHLVWIALFLSAYSAFGQQPVPGQVLTEYYRLKESLVEGNVTAAATAAGQLGRELNMVDYKTVTEGNLATLLKDASAIAGADKLEMQRSRFENLSANFVTLAKNVHLTHDPVYIVYCPMKKAYWLSEKAEVINPYYGQSMLYCGSVTDSLKH